MRIDKYGQPILNENDLCDLFLRDPTRTIKKAYTEHPLDLDQVFLSIENIPKLTQYVDIESSVEEFDKKYSYKIYSGRIGDEINNKHLIITNYAI
jgi:hypothetical protein